MKCSKCHYDSIREGASFCPNCGEKIVEISNPTTQIRVTQKVGIVKGGKVKGVDIGKVLGNVTIKSTIKQFEKKIVQGNYVDHQTITNNIMLLGPTVLEEIVKRLTSLQGVDKQTLQNLGAQNVPDNVSHQIAEIVAAQKEVETRGVLLNPQAAYHMGMLAAYDRKYKEALIYFHQAYEADPEFSDAFESVAWLLQSLSIDDLNVRNYTAALEKLKEARNAALHTDPLNLNALTQRGYIAKTLAQVSDAMNDKLNKQKYYEEAAKLFQHVIQLEPNNAGAHNGMGNIEHSLGNIDAAIKAYNQAIDLLPDYTAAHHDLALALEDKMNSDPTCKDSWCQKAIQEWQKTYDLAPRDPGFSAEYILKIGQRIMWLKKQCGNVR